MPEINFTTMTNRSLAAEVLAMMRALYSEDEAATPADHERFPLTIECLLSEPGRGRIVLFIEGASLRGYALLIPYWSNEFGGALLFVDELFVTPEARNRGIGRRFFEFLAVERPFDAVAVALEVSPINTRARGFYESLGFVLRQNAVLTRRFPAKPPGICRG
jgi:GNAT superfamily N-acetyltransferase